MAFTAIPNSDIDPGSPLTTGLMTALRDNDDFLLTQVAGQILVEKKEITGDVTSVTFSGLDGDTDEVYKLFGKIIIDGGTFDIDLEPNNLTASQSGVLWRAASNGTTLASSLSRLMLVRADSISAGQEELSFEATLFARKTVNSVVQDRTFHSIARSKFGSNEAVQTMACKWADTSTNITSLVINAGEASGIRDGSTIALYKMRQS